MTSVIWLLPFRPAFGIDLQELEQRRSRGISFPERQLASGCSWRKCAPPMKPAFPAAAPLLLLRRLT